MVALRWLEKSPIGQKMTIMTAVMEGITRLLLENFGDGECMKRLNSVGNFSQ